MPASGDGLRLERGGWDRLRTGGPPLTPAAIGEREGRPAQLFGMSGVGSPTPQAMKNGRTLKIPMCCNGQQNGEQQNQRKRYPKNPAHRDLSLELIERSAGRKVHLERAP